MTERGLPIVDGAPACPFVAFEDDRDERASSPDHRHRCYAEARPAPRALAHQEAYCLSSAFPVCPTFQDWARREAAHSRADGPRSGDAASAAAALAADLPQRNPPRNWSAPPPWASRADAGPGDADSGDDWSEPAAAAGVPAQGRGLSGSYADRVASGGDTGDSGAAPVHPGDPGEDPDDDAGARDDEESSAGAGAAGAAMAGGAAAGGAAAGAAAAGADAATGAPARMRDRDPVYAAAFDRSDADHAAPPMPRRERRRDSNAPEWERARPAEVYPTLRARRLPELSIPPLLVAVVALALAAAVLFALPGLLGFGSPSAVSSATPSLLASSAPASLAPTAVPQPTPHIYIVQSGDTMSRIAKKFKVALGDLIAANETTIPNPDQLQIGDEVTIPAPTPSELPAASSPPASG
jgi:hypothetical protein